MAFKCGRGVQFSTCCGQQQGGGPMPLRWYDANAEPFPESSTCIKNQMCNRCGQFNCNCTNPCLHCGQRPCACPVNCRKCHNLMCAKCGKRKQQTGGSCGAQHPMQQTGSARSNQSAGGCCGNNVYKYRYFNDFGRMDDHFQYNSDNMSQEGGGAVGAPFYVFTSEKPIRWNYQMENVPVFDKIGQNRFWY